MATKKPPKPKVTLTIYTYSENWYWLCRLPKDALLKPRWLTGARKTRKGAINNARRTLTALRLYEVWDIIEEIKER